MQRYFIDKIDFDKNIIVGDDVFHISKVMRNKPNDLIEVCSNNKAYIAKIIEITSEFVTFNVVEELEEKNENKPKITLIQGFPKGDKTFDIIKHGTELGVDEIILLQMKRSIVKVDTSKVDSKLTRFNKIAKEAAEQAHRNTIPNVSMLNNHNNLDFSRYGLKLLLDEEEAKKIDGRLLTDINFNNINSIAFVIGPEGGIDASEREYFVKNGFLPISIGNNILRTETASLAFLAMLNYIYMERK